LIEETIMLIRAVYEDGQLRLLDDVELAEGETIEIAIVSKQPSGDQIRVLGLHPGAMTTTDDFDSPLPDEFWFGE
jgi:hypothetical protein